MGGREPETGEAARAVLVDGGAGEERPGRRRRPAKWIPPVMRELGEATTSAGAALRWTGGGARRSAMEGKRGSGGRKGERAK